MTHQVLIRQDTINPQVSRNGIDLFREGAGEAGAVWRPFQIVSLLDMKRLYGYTLFNAYWRFLELASEIEEGFIEFGPNFILPELKAKEVNIRVSLLLAECEKAGLDTALERAFRLRHIGEPTHEPDKYPLERIRHEMLEILRDVDKDLARRKFFALSELESKQFNLKHPFGERVHSDFESSQFDVAEAWKCYCLDRHTACVFHCMRVLEKGLHALANDLNAKFGTNIVFKKGIEFQNWGTLIGKIEKEINIVLDPNRQPPANMADLSFYSKAAKEFFYFKIAWRDDSAHSRSRYDEKEAKLILEHVHAFMRHLAKGGLKE